MTQSRSTPESTPPGASPAASGEEGRRDRWLRRVKQGASRLKDRLPERPSVQRRLRQIDDAFVRDGANQTSEDDVAEVVRQADAIEARFQRDDGPLGRLIDDGRVLLALVRDAWEGTYRRVPRWSVAAAAFALLYALNPLDLIPDALPVVGALDDAAVVSLTLFMIERDLDAYRAWRSALAPPNDDEGYADSEQKRNAGER